MARTYGWYFYKTLGVRVSWLGGSGGRTIDLTGSVGFGIGGGAFIH